MCMHEKPCSSDHATVSNPSGGVSGAVLWHGMERQCAHHKSARSVFRTKAAVMGLGLWHREVLPETPRFHWMFDFELFFAYYAEIFPCCPFFMNPTFSYKTAGAECAL